jgi:peptidoglycan/xylan/chitin deacetylase (PgdA/CDA1 family)
MTPAPGLIVMYHYVRNDDDRDIPAGIRPMLTSQFEEQLDWLGEHYSILHPQQFLNWLAGQHETEKPPCLLTFDDGTADHATVVTPILAARNLSGVFFVLTGPAEESLMPLTHALHWLLSQPDEKTWRLFQQLAREELHDESALGDPAEAKRIYHYEPELRARIKYAANMALPPQATATILHRAAEQARIALKDLARQWFVAPAQIQQMHQAGMTIGLHGHSHSSLQTLGEDGIRQEIAHASNYLTNLTGEIPTWWACPFGGAGASPAALAAMQDAMRRANLRAAVTTQQSPVTRAADVFALPRYDCIDLPPKKSTPPVELGLS